MSSDDKSLRKTGDTSRRTFVKATGVTAATGALGGLAGCGGGGGNGDGSDGDTTTSSSDGSGGSGTTTIQFLSGNAAENSMIRNHFQSSMKDFEEKNGSVQVNLQATSYGDIKTKLSSTVSSGNPPALAEAGALGLQYYNQGDVPDHSPFFEQTEGLPDNLTNQAAPKFRGNWWSGGALRHTNNNLGINVQAFKKAGVTDPMSDLETWSDFYGYLEEIDANQDIYAWEETGVSGDLESYWGEARTAYTGGTDPWIRGSGTDPEVIIGSDHEDAPKTDGMIKNCVKLAKQFSSPSAASRGDEEIPSLMLTDQVASFAYAIPTASRWTSTKSDVKFGWQGGDGDVMLLPLPKVDPDYGQAVGIPELEGVEGEHGGHLWALEQCQSIFDVSDAKQQAAWDLQVYTLKDEDFVLPAWGQHYQAIPGYQPLGTKILDSYDLSQWYTQSVKNLNNYTKQYQSTGAGWDVKGTNQIRWTDINETISQAIAGQHTVDETPGLIRESVLETLDSQNT